MGKKDRGAKRGKDARGYHDRVAGRYDAIYHHITPTDTDPGTNLDWWLSTGSSHPWHPNQKQPATEWEARIDALMLRQSTTLDRAQRQRLFAEVQKLFVAHNPVISAETIALQLAPLMQPLGADVGLWRGQGRHRHLYPLAGDPSGPARHPR